MPDVSETTSIGGRRREIRVTLGKERLTGFCLTPDPVTQALGGANQRSDSGLEPAVTISVAKRPGKNAVDIASRVLAKVDGMEGSLLPTDTTITVTRNYGETANEKSGALLFHMGITLFSITLLIAFALGRRKSLVVAISIPDTLSGIVRFAVMLRIGFLLDDAMVVGAY